MKSTQAPAFNRWLIPLGAVAVHICIGSVYAWSTFNRPIKALFPNDPSAALGGPWVELRYYLAAVLAVGFLLTTQVRPLRIRESAR